ncbi:type IV toxin-antitoxin system AbiEi family antitoxin domain-containing protein [Pyramidobacter piscolens]|uniref:type IV toxin-antitoxin system AbiEi family antitoxin domain-containing protein n=1 Tax=Pyramidobacter piscolens TaxID=638849 RepID=UPI002AB13CD0|nr:type IV toxin-antitoxin system AbiEi family antitoxin domain-containing protein [Pyramidobacter piscolens]
MPGETREGTTEDLAQLLGLSKRSVQRWIEKGAAVKIRRGVYDLPATLKAYYESQGEAPKEKSAGQASPGTPPGKAVDIPSLPCTTADLALLFGFTSTRRVQQLVTDGAIVKTGEEFTLGEAVRSYCDYLKGIGSPSSADLEAQRTRLVKAQADKAEIAVKVLLGELLPADAVLVAWSNILAIVKTAMLNLPNKLAPRLAVETDITTIKDTMESEVKTALGELQNFDISECVEKSLPAGSDDAGATEETDGQ